MQVNAARAVGPATHHRSAALDRVRKLLERLGKRLAEGERFERRLCWLLPLALRGAIKLLVGGEDAGEMGVARRGRIKGAGGSVEWAGRKWMSGKKSKVEGRWLRAVRCVVTSASRTRHGRASKQQEFVRRDEDWRERGAGEGVGRVGIGVSKRTGSRKSNEPQVSRRSHDRAMPGWLKNRHARGRCVGARVNYIVWT